MPHTIFTAARGRAAAAAALAAVAALTAFGAAPGFAAGPRVTLYSSDLGFVRESRTFELSGARDTVRLTDVPERIDFTSVRLVPSDASRVTRLAYRYDVATGAALIDRARGSRVALTLGLPGLIIGGGTIAWLLARHSGTGSVGGGALPGFPHEIGRLLFKDFLLPFEVTSVLILIAIMGAVVLASPPKGGGEPVELPPAAQREE